MVDVRITEFANADFNESLQCHYALLNVLAPFLSGYNPQVPATISDCFKAFRRSDGIKNTVEDYRITGSIKHVLYPERSYNCCTMAVLGALATYEGLLPNFKRANLKIIDLDSQASPHAAVELTDHSNDVRIFDLWSSPNLSPSYSVKMGRVLPVGYVVECGSPTAHNTVKGYIADFAYRMATCKVD